MRFNGIVVIVYGLLTIIGGVMGFVKAGSLVSLSMGALFGIGLVLSGVAAYKERNAGFYSALVLTGLLVIFFMYRFILTQNLIPAGFMSAISLIVLIALFLGGTAKERR